MTDVNVNALRKTFSSAIASSNFEARGRINVSLDFSTGSGSGTINVERSFDGGATFEIVAAYTADTITQLIEPEPGVLYRFNCAIFTSGAIACRMGY